jgi:hypothetical protein
VAGPSHRPTEETRLLLLTKVEADPRGLSGVAKLLGVKPPTLHEFLHTAGAGSKVFPKLCKLYNLDPFENLALDDDQRELLRILDDARQRGRDGSAIVDAFRTLVSDGSSSGPRPTSPKSRGSQSS